MFLIEKLIRSKRVFYEDSGSFLSGRAEFEDMGLWAGFSNHSTIPINTPKTAKGLHYRHCVLFFRQ